MQQKKENFSEKWLRKYCLNVQNEEKDGKKD